MSKSAHFHRLSVRDASQTLNKNIGSNNEWGDSLSISETSALVECVGCGRRFVPTGRQRYCSHECYSGALRIPIEQRFWTKVNKFGPVPAHQPQLGHCWIWTAATIRGYGQISRNRKPAYAHRLSYEWAYGPLPAAQSVLHKCDEPLCVRPDHLFLGTQQDNLADARAKGRLDESRPRHATLTYQDRLDIYGARQYRGVCLELAAKYGVTKSCISAIRKGRFARLPEIANVEPVPTPATVRVPFKGDLHLAQPSAAAQPFLDNPVVSPFVEISR